MKIVIITTEPSGDYLGFHLLKSLKNIKLTNIKVYGVGGDLMESIGFESWIKIEKFNTIGIIEVAFRIFKFLKLMRIIKQKINHVRPDFLITIDSPSLSYRLARSLQNLRKKKNTKFIHYVAPKVWAWKEYRAKIFAKYYDKMATLFNFETIYFKKYGLETKFIGHSIFFENENNRSKKKIISFLPGSREIEIKNNLKTLKEIISEINFKLPQFKIYILTFNRFVNSLKNQLNDCNVSIISDNETKRRVMMESFLAVAASGTVTLELAKFLTPTIVVYKANFFTQIIIKNLVKVKYASLINIYFKKEVIPEFIFESFTCKNVFQEIISLIKNKKKREMQIKYMRLFSKEMLYKKKNPSELFIKEVMDI